MALPRAPLSIRRLLRALTRADGGTQLLEYGLLTLAIGLTGLLVFRGFSTKMTTAYTNWNTNTQAIWEPCPPGGCP